MHEHWAKLAVDYYQCSQKKHFDFDFFSHMTSPPPDHRDRTDITEAQWSQLSVCNCAVEASIPMAPMAMGSGIVQ